LFWDGVVVTDRWPMEALGRKGGKGVNMSAEEDYLVEVWGWLDHGAEMQ